MKQLMWLRIVHSGDWCLCLALCMPAMNEFNISTVQVSEWTVPIQQWILQALTRNRDMSYLSTSEHWCHGSSCTGACNTSHIMWHAGCWSHRLDTIRSFIYSTHSTRQNSYTGNMCTHKWRLWIFIRLYLHVRQMRHTGTLERTGWGMVNYLCARQRVVKCSPCFL